MQPCDPPDDLPAALRARLVGADWRRDAMGMSGAQVYRVVSAGQPPCYLKLARGAHRVELRAECDRLRWLAGRLPVPAVRGWVDDALNDAAGAAWLLLAEAPGVMACDPLVVGDPARVVETLAMGLRAVHSLSIAECPFDMRLDQRLARARWGIEAGVADVVAVHEDLGLSAEELLQRLVETRPTEPHGDLVFTHGDYCLPNVLLDSATLRVSGYLDWGRAGIADRYQDLAIGARSVWHNLGDEWSEPFLRAYDDAPLDRERLAWYELLDELF